MKLSKVLSIIFPFLSQTKNYARLVGVILFAIGLIGFAFRSDGSLPDLYLGGALVLGFWGIVCGLWDSGGKYQPQRSINRVPSADRVIDRAPIQR